MYAIGLASQTDKIDVVLHFVRCRASYRYLLQHVGASINLAALHHRYGDTRTAIELYRVAAEVVDPGDSDMIVMLR